MNKSMKRTGLRPYVIRQIRRRLLVLAFAYASALMPSSAQCTEDAAPSPTEEPNGELPPNYFINKNFLRCGGKDVLILTSCVDYEEALPYCFNQHISIYDNKSSSSSSLNYSYAFDNGNQQFISKADCVPAEGKAYLILESTNFGNCHTCEWIDVYSIDGKYLGSSEGMYDAKNFVHFPIPRKLDEHLLSSKVPELASTNISRARPRKPRIGHRKPRILSR